MNTLDQLKSMTTVVADTGDIASIEQYTPQDATTNPSLILKAVASGTYDHLLEEAVSFAQGSGLSGEQTLSAALERLTTNFGREILKLVPGRVSTEVDAYLSFNTAATIAKARALIAQYEDSGVDRDRILIKIASTWEGIQAARVLEAEGIHCNLTLLFSIAQAIACADAKVTLISPFVGRIYDWYRAENGGEDIPAEKDPGVESVTAIYNYYKRHGHTTEVMGASFRHSGQITGLAGCDLLTISPGLLEELQNSDQPLEQKLNAATADKMDIPVMDPSEESFRWLMNEDAMATEKLAQGIRGFHKDHMTLTKTLRDALS